MLFISDGIFDEYMASPMKEKVSEFITKKTYTVSNSPFTYRQINTLEEDKLLPYRDNDNGWHKFSLRDLVYLNVLSDLKKFGMKHPELRQLNQVFYGEFAPAQDNKLADVHINKLISEHVIGCVLGGVEITMFIDTKGQIAFYDPLFYSLMFDNSQPKIQININSVVNGLLKELGYPEIPVNTSVKKSAFNWFKEGLTPKEEELMKVIRDEGYSTIKIIKKDGKVAVVHAEKVPTDNPGITSQDVVKMIAAKDYQNIIVTKRDGVIVNCKVEETIKLS